MRIKNKALYKVILISLFTIGCSSLIAEETWIEINKSKIPEYIIKNKPLFKDHGFVNYHDVKSIVKRDDITYFNCNNILTSPNEHFLIPTL